MKNAALSLLAFAIATAQPYIVADEASDAKIKDLEAQVSKLEQRVAKLEKEAKPAAAEKQKIDPKRAELVRKAREKMQEEDKKLSPAEAEEIERLYQVANKNWNSEEAKLNLRTLIAKYKTGNRIGCATLYLGQTSSGDEQLDYLEQAAQDYPNCYYGDGVQVGAYARFMLYKLYREKGDNDLAAKQAAELRKLYPDAIDHGGNNLLQLLGLEAEEGKAKK